MAILKVGNSLLKMTINKALSVAQSGDTIHLAAGKYTINKTITQALTFEPECVGSVVVLTGSFTVDQASCIFKNIEFQCQVSEQNLFTANKSQLMFEHCYFYGTETKLARAILLTASNLTLYYCSFSGLSSNAIKANSSSKIMVYNSLFKNLKDTSAIYLHSSQLNIKDTRFINITTNSINAIGDSHIKAVDCEWEITQAPALYLNPTVTAEITSSVFKGSSTAIFAQKATLILQSCDFRNLDGSALLNTKPATIINHLFKGMEHSSVIEIEDSKLDLQSSRFIDIPIHAIESIGVSVVIAHDCLWQVNNMAVLYLHPKGTAQISQSVLKGSNAIVCVQQASLILRACELLGITDNHAVRVKEDGQLVITDCLFKNIAQFPAVKVESSSLKMANSRFINIQSNAVNAVQDSRVSIDGCQFDHIVGHEVIFAQAETMMTIKDCHHEGKVMVDSMPVINEKMPISPILPIENGGDLWFLNNDTVDKLQANMDKYINCNEETWRKK